MKMEMYLLSSEKSLMFNLSMLIFLLCIFSSMKNINPMKICWKLLTMMICSSSMMWLNTSMTWGSLIMTMVFLGGILITFMMISSLIPSKKMKMVNLNKYILLMSSLLILTTSMYNMENSMESVIMKENLNNKEMVIFLTLIIILYFCTMSNICSKEYNSIRYFL